jgi:kynureninase
LEVFAEAGMENLAVKGRKLSAYLIHILKEINKRLPDPFIQILTPEAENERGCQVSILMLHRGKEIFDALLKEGVIADWREPNVIRVAPVPLYNSFEDVYRFGEIIQSCQQK